MEIIEYPKWIYHETEKAKIIQDEDEREAHKDWKDSPHEFVNYGKAGVDMKDPIAVQLAGEATQDVVDMANDSLKLGDMKVKQLAAYAKEHFDVVIKVGGRKRKDVAKEVKNLMNG
jgi:hypothetical protein